jgi:hypothetical protein
MRSRLRWGTSPEIASALIWLPRSSCSICSAVGAWLGQRYLAGFVDRVDFGAGVFVPMMVAGVAILLVLAIAAARHVRQALHVQPIEALR